MSDHWIIVVPKPSGHLPPMEKVEDVRSFLEKLAPHADEIEVITHDSIRLFDCGANLETISCPSCGSIIDFDWWGNTTSRDYNEQTENPGFRLEKYPLPCCATHASLDDLVYDFNQAFGRLAVSAMNPNIGALKDDQIAEIEDTLGCEVSIVYQHI